MKVSIAKAEENNGGGNWDNCKWISIKNKINKNLIKIFLM